MTKREYYFNKINEFKNDIDRLRKNYNLIETPDVWLNKNGFLASKSHVELLNTYYQILNVDLDSINITYDNYKKVALDYEKYRIEYLDILENEFQLKYQIYQQDHDKYFNFQSFIEIWHHLDQLYDKNEKMERQISLILKKLNCKNN